MPKLQGTEEIRALEKRYNFKFDKSLGQNFLNDEQVLCDIAEACGAGPDDLVIEIGPGMGFLTMALAENAGKVIAVEIDERLIPILEKNLAFYRNIEVVNADIMQTDLKALIAEKGLPANGEKPKNVKIVGNLPYYITTPILTSLLEAETGAESITVMVQKEVADRMLAAPGERPYCVLTAMLNYYAKTELVRDVEAELFVPRPKVDSAVVKLTLLENKGAKVKDPRLLFRVIKAGFGLRRKTLANALEGGGFSKSGVSAALESSGIDPRRRAETLSIEEFARLSDALGETV